MTSTALAAPDAPAELSELDIARVACEGRSLLIDSRGIAADMLGGYSAPYVRAVLADPAAPQPVQVNGNGAFLYVRLEVALYLLRRERVSSQAKRERTKAATAKRLGAHATRGSGRRALGHAVRDDLPQGGA